MKKVLGKHPLVSIDSNIFIYHFEANPEFIEKTTFILTQLREDKWIGITSIISLIELLGFQAPEKVLVGIRESFFTTPNLRIVGVEQDVAEAAARIRREYRFSLPDSIQIATALYGKAKAFITNDESLKKFKELKVILLKEL